VSLVLEAEEIRSILSLYHLDGLEGWGPVRGHQGRYWVQVGGDRYTLRIAARRRFSDLVFEKDFIKHLGDRCLPVPYIVENVASGAFTPWEARGRYVTLFADVPGRELGHFEIRTKHIRAIGRCLADMHAAAAEFTGHRHNIWGLDELTELIERLQRGLDRKRLARRHADDVAILADELREQKRREPGGRSGAIHGALFVRSAVFDGGRLCAVSEFDNACVERHTWDLAVAVNNWCWEPSAEQQGGPAGRFATAKVNAMVGEYEKRRVLAPRERAELAEDLRLTALRFAVGRLIAFELRRTKDAPYRDYRHFTSRLRALRGRSPI